MNLMNELVQFGCSDRFQISARWLVDDESRECLPLDYGWSMGELRLVVGGQLLTRHQLYGGERESISWYLGPILDWLLENWSSLLHEEGFTWQTQTAESAATTVVAALERYAIAEGERSREIYKKLHEWWKRHALRAADSSALYPDVYFRRIGDDVEVSWLDRQPPYAPDGFALQLNSGSVQLPPEDVAGPLWDFLRWAINTAPVHGERDKKQVFHLREKFEILSAAPSRDLEAAHLADSALRDILEEVKAQKGWQPMHRRSENFPVILELDPAVLMFGGLDVSIDRSDAEELLALLVESYGGRQSEALDALVDTPAITAFLKPYTHGYELAEELREDLGIDRDDVYVDVLKIIQSLGIKVVRRKLNTSGVRGVAVAGNGFSPVILINTNSPYNKNEPGRRFTLAHEFCHILFDRTRAKRVSHVSGPWASERVEKRANAFATMFLASSSALDGAWEDASRRNIQRLAKKFKVGYTALVEHLHNIDIISHEQHAYLMTSSSRK